MDAQSSIFRYARLTGLDARGRLHGSIIDKRALVVMLQQDGCEGARVFYGRNDNGRRVAIVWPVNANYENMTRNEVYMLPVQDLCPRNCDFQFMQDDYNMPTRQGRAVPVDANDALRWINRYARSAPAAQTTSVLIQKGAVLQGLINDRECFGIRIYHTLEPDLINASVYLVGTDYYGHSNWDGPAYYADNTSLCVGNCY